MFHVRLTNTGQTHRFDQFSHPHEPGAHIGWQGLQLTVDGGIQRVNCPRIP